MIQCLRKNHLGLHLASEMLEGQLQTEINNYNKIVLLLIYLILVSVAQNTQLDFRENRRTTRNTSPLQYFTWNARTTRWNNSRQSQHSSIIASCHFPEQRVFILDILHTQHVDTIMKERAFSKTSKLPAVEQWKFDMTKWSQQVDDYLRFSPSLSSRINHSNRELGGRQSVQKYIFQTRAVDSESMAYQNMTCKYAYNFKWNHIWMTNSRHSIQDLHCFCGSRTELVSNHLLQTIIIRCAV